MIMKMYEILRNKEEINAAGHFSHPVLRHMLVRMLPYAQRD
jgi:hypothetical protein